MKDLYEVKAISNKKELSKFLKPLYIIEDYTASDADYRDFQEKMYTIIKGCFEHKECREYPVKFKFYLKDTKEHVLELRHFIINVFCWYPFINLHEISGVWDESYILDCVNGIPELTGYVNDKIITTLRDYNIRNTVVNRCVSEVLYNLRRISIDFSLIMNLTLSTEVFLDVYKNIPRMKEIMETKFELDKQPAEIEHELAEIQEEEINIFKSLKDNPVGIILRANTGIKHRICA